MKNREGKSMIEAYTQKVYTKLEGLEHKPKLYILNNKCSRCIQTFLEKKGTRQHHVAPHNQRVNAAESPTHILGGPVFGSHLELLKLSLSFFRLDVPNLEILKIGDIPGMSSNSIMPFHNLDPKLVH